MEKYSALVDYLMHTLEEAAKLTSNPWDDLVASTARTVLDKYFTCPHEETKKDGLMYASEEMKALPLWVLPLVLKLVEFLRDLDFKKVQE